MAKRLWHFREEAFGHAGAAGWTGQFRAASRAIDVVPMDVAPSAEISSTGLDHFKPYGYLTASGAWVSGDILAYTPPVTALDDDQSALAFFEVDSASANWVGLGVRLSGSAGAENGYFAWLRGASGLALDKVVAGTRTALGLTVAKTFGASSEGWFVRLEANGTTVRCRAWRWDEPEPTGWDILVTDSSVTTGLSGLAARLADSTTGEILRRPRFLSVDDAGASLDAPMPKTRAEVLALSEGNVKPVHIVQLGVLGQTSAGVAQDSKVCVASVPFVSSSVDDPASTAYDDVVVQLPTFRVAASEIFTGKSQQGFGDLVIASEAGVRDQWLAWAWDGRAAEIWVGALGWPRWDFVKVLTGTIAEVTAVDESLVFKLRDKSAKVARRFQENRVNSLPAPWQKGDVFNCEPCYFGSGSLYVYNDFTGGVLDQVFSGVRDNGVAVTASVTLLNVSFDLASAAAGRITFDSADASFTFSHQEIFEAAAVKGGIADTEIYSGAGVGDPADIADTAPAGLYVKDETTTGAVLDEIAASGSLFWWFDRVGQLRVARFEAPATTPHHVIEQDDVAKGSLRLERLIPPSDPEYLYARRNFTVQKDGIGGSVSEPDRALYGAVGTLATFTPTYSGLDTPDNHDGKRTPPARVTLYRDQADAQAEGERLHEIRRKMGGVYSVTVRAFVPTYGLGETLQLTHERLGFENGRMGLIVGLEEDFQRGSVRITFFSTIDGQFPVTSAAYPVVGESEFY